MQKCKLCGANLDPGEACDCGVERYGLEIGDRVRVIVPSSSLYKRVGTIVGYGPWASREVEFYIEGHCFAYAAVTFWPKELELAQKNTV